VRQVSLGSVHPDVLTPFLAASRADTFAAVALQATHALRGRAIINVNSTATGGGVAEMLAGLLSYARGLDLDVRWYVIDAPPEFFEITKRVHNRVYGARGDGGPLGPAERATYEAVLAAQRDELLAVTRPGDAVLLHDPQTLGMAPALHAAGARVVWRCHIGADRQTTDTALGWQFLSPYLDDVDAVVVSRDIFAPPGVHPERLFVIPPSIDPLAVKNAPLDDDLVDRLLVHAGLQQGRPGEAPVFLRRDGSPARLDRRADVVQLGPPVPADAPLVVQVSRWDRLKDMAGVMRAFSKHVDGEGDAHLILAGPNVSGVADDPEGATVLRECERAWRALPHARRERVHIACLPTADVDENAVIVNALQRRASVVAQKSIAEGFGLTVVEAMWKSRPVIATAVGGISEQIVDDRCGLLVPDPADLDAFGLALRGLLEDPARAAAMGVAARERAAEFLPDVHLIRWANLLMSMIGESPAPVPA
jgi:trehalose synthase